GSGVPGAACGQGSARRGGPIRVAAPPQSIPSFLRIRGPLPNIRTAFLLAGSGESARGRYERSVVAALAVHLVRELRDGGRAGRDLDRCANRPAAIRLAGIRDESRGTASAIRLSLRPRRSVRARRRDRGAGRILAR